MKNCIYITRSIREQAYQTSLGKGLRINLEHASKAMIRLLQFLYLKDASLLEGDIQTLLSMDVQYFD